jgi:hypothetical protein
LNLGKRILRFIIWLGVVLLQLVMTQVVTFLFSLLVPGMEDFPQTRPVLFIVALGIAFTIGIFLPGWLALNRRWLASEPRYAVRLVATLIGAYVPLLVALIVYHPLEPGNPFFFISMLAGILGFHAPGWVIRK